MFIKDWRIKVYKALLIKGYKRLAHKGLVTGAPGSAAVVRPSRPPAMIAACGRVCH
jgi:hypothetical protein